MELSEYQRQAATTAIYPAKGEFAGKAYTILGMAGEAGECANQMKKILRDDNTTITEERRMLIRDEVGDVLWYVAQTCTEFGFSLDVVAQINLAKLADRHERGAVSGDRRLGGH